MRSRGDAVTESRSKDLLAALDEASLSRFHLRAVLVSGMGFFTDAYDLFVIGIASTLITKDWNLGSGKLALLNSTMLFAAFLGALVFGRFADVAGRKRVYWLVAAIMVVAAVGSALSPSYWVLIAFRFLLGFGVGGDYPVSAVLMSEYANRKDRGKLVGMVFGTQALGLIVGPLIALALLGAGASDGVAWRVMLGLGAVPAAAVIYLRRKMPESPRYQVQVQGNAAQAASQISEFTGGQVSANGTGRAPDGPAGVPGQPPVPGPAGRDGGNLVPPRLRLLREHDLHPADPRPDLPERLDHDQDRPATGDLRGGGGAGLRAGDRPDGPDRAPAAAAGRVRDDGALFPDHRGGAGHDHHGGPVPAGIRGQLLLHRVRPEHDHLRAAQRAVPGRHAGDRTRDLRRHRQARRLHRGLPVPGAADLARPARHPPAHRRGIRPRLRAHPRAARTCRAQPGRHRRQHARRGRPASAAGRSAISPLTFQSRGCSP